MNIKKLLLSALLLTTTGFAYAEDTTDYFKIDDCVDDNAIIAGVDDRTKGIIKINLVNEYDWVAFQFDLHLPEGVEIGMYKNPRGKLVPDYANTNRLTDASEKDFSYEMNKISEGVYRFIAYNNSNDQIWVNEDENDLSVFTIRLIATDQASTGTFTGWIEGAILSNSHDEGQGAQVTGANCPKTESQFTIQINAKIGEGGYGSFSWPRDVDFTNDTNVKGIYIPDGTPTEGWLKLKEVTSKKVPAGTGVFIKGTAGEIVNPETTTSEVTSIEKTLGETSAEPYTAGSNVYALKTVSGKAGLHKVNSGVVIPKYKAYLTNTSGAKYFSFGDTATSIDALDMAEEEGDIYTLGGQKVQKTTMKGVYIKNGQKVVVK